MIALSLVPIDMRHAAWPGEPIRAKSKPVAPTCDRARFRIVLDVGHTAEAPGAKSARNVGEFDFNLRLAKRIEEKLRTEGFAATSLMVTEGQARPSLFNRVADANDAKANLVLRSTTIPCPIPFSRNGNTKATRATSATGSAVTRCSFPATIENSCRA
jgi:N-acetylmuramoyl-L-alanine amidase